MDFSTERICTDTRRQVQYVVHCLNGSDRQQLSL